MEITLVKQTAEREGEFRARNCSYRNWLSRFHDSVILISQSDCCNNVARTHVTSRTLTTFARGYIVMIGCVLCYRREVSIGSYDRRILWKKRLIPGAWPFLAFDDFWPFRWWIRWFTNIDISWIESLSYLHLSVELSELKILDIFILFPMSSCESLLLK